MSPCGCSGTKKAPAGRSLAPVGEIGLLKIVQVSEEHYDVYGQVTDQRYPFSVKPQLYVDTRDAAYLLKDGVFELA
jgi:hypothetical protein